jgi:hypothetical protein
MMTRVLFVETARDDPTKEILRREYEIEGDVVHFDALIVKFDNRYVAGGKGRALYLWRRIFGEKTAPASAEPIEEPGAEPKDEAPAAVSPEKRKSILDELARGKITAEDAVKLLQGE